MIITIAIALHIAKSLVLGSPSAPAVAAATPAPFDTARKGKKQKPPKEIASHDTQESDPNIPYVSVSDCHACPAPCPEQDHLHYPSYLKMDYELPLLHSMKPYTRHVVISTGQDDWAADIDEDKDSLAPYLQKAIHEGQQRLKAANGGRDPPRIVLTNSSRKCELWDGPGWQVMILPDQIVVNNVTPEQCDDFFEAFLKPAVGMVDGGHHDSQLSSEKKSELAVEKDQGANAVVMICSHKKRDKRCGVTAPILQKEFMRILRSKDLYGDCEGDVEIWLVSHIGGHKFAGNVIVHKSEGMAIWYGRVEPCHAQAIVEATIERGEVIKELFRGSMIGSFDSQKKIAW
ncbi:Sucrase/ferredoxin-like-domain-containing protein [Dissophora ornata]|nr:Sucrase/ferredoxin-like-domain-containing protein [Dissophora ornata]